MTDYDTAAEALEAQAEEARQAAIDARDENAPEGETEEEYNERIEAVRATGIFGDTPTDPTIGDVVVPTSDEEGAGVDVAEADVAAEEGDEDAEDASVEEVRRQDSAPAQEVQDAADDPTDLSDVGRDENDENDS